MKSESCRQESENEKKFIVGGGKLINIKLFIDCLVSEKKINQIIEINNSLLSYWQTLFELHFCSAKECGYHLTQNSVHIIEGRIITDVQNTLIINGGLCEPCFKRILNINKRLLETDPLS